MEHGGPARLPRRGEGGDAVDTLVPLRLRECRPLVQGREVLGKICDDRIVIVNSSLCYFFAQASGSDDNYVFVYKYSSVSLGPTTFGSSSSAGNKASKCKESWPRCFTLQGHTMDVLDLDWSASGILASASIDNRVLIWDLGFQHASSLQTMGGGKGSLLPSIVAPIKVLSGHQSFVRGVSFDPIMKYLATYGADNTLILWDTETWTESHRATEPLKEISDRVLFTRLSWAPDGASLCVTSSFKSTKPISAVLKRDSWQSVADLVGHRVETMSCRFLPCIINHSSPTNGKQHEKSTDVSSESGSSQSRTVPSCFVAVGDLEVRKHAFMNFTVWAHKLITKCLYLSVVSLILNIEC